MSHRFRPSTYAQIILLRHRLALAFSQQDMESVLSLSGEIDAIQLTVWEDSLARSLAADQPRKQSCFT